MIFITADTHGELERLTDKKLKFIKKFDTLIVLGDFGFVWSGDKQQEKNLKKISRLPFKVLFIDGYNENFKALEQYPDTVYRGAQAKEICPGQVYYIKRGEILEIRSIFAGGFTYENFRSGTCQDQLVAFHTRAAARRLPRAGHADAVP